MIQLPCVVEKVVDGDTIQVSFHLRFNVRFLDCWAAEKNTEDGKRAKAYLESIIAKGDNITVDIPMIAGNMPGITFARLLGYVRKGDVNLSDEMVKNGHATRGKVVGADFSEDVL